MLQGIVAGNRNNDFHFYQSESEQVGQSENKEFRTRLARHLIHSGYRVLS